MWTVHKGGVLCTLFSNYHISLLHKLKMRIKHKNNSSSLIKKLKEKLEGCRGGATTHDGGATAPKGFTFHL
jgi:hypothetical protein